VLARLPPEASIAHVAAAMAFLSLNVALATVLGRRWTEAPAEAAAGGLEPAEAAALSRGAIACAAAVYAQIILGAVPRHLHGGVEGVAPHILWAFVVATGAILLAARIWSRHARRPGLLHPALALLFLVILQFFLGFAAFLNRPAAVKAPGTPLYEVVASVHHAAGVLLLAAAVVLALRSWRYRSLLASGAFLPAAGLRFEAGAWGLEAGGGPA
jgi:heme A synthase